MLFKLDGTQKDNFYDRLFNIVRKLGEQEIVVIAGHLNVMLEVMQKKSLRSIEVMVMGKGFWNFVQL